MRALTPETNVLSDVRATGGDSAQARRAEIAKLWEDVRQLNKDISNNLSTLTDKGYIDDQTMEDLNEERARIDAMDPNDPKRVEAEKAYQSKVQSSLYKAREAAQDANDQPAIDMIDDTFNKNEITNGKTRKIGKILESKQAAPEPKNQPPATFPVADANKAENQSPSAAPKNTPPANDLGF